MSDVLTDAQKKCSKCCNVLCVVAFSKNASSKDGFCVNCKTCMKKSLKEWNEANPEKKKARKSRYHEKNKAFVNNKSKLWRESNPKKFAEVVLKCHKLNPESVLKAKIKWQKNNPHKGAAAASKRRASKLKSIPQWIDLEFETFVIDEAYKISSMRSKLTGIKHHVDHIVPLQSDYVCGLHYSANLRVITASENQSKNNRYWPGM